MKSFPLFYLPRLQNSLTCYLLLIDRDASIWGWMDYMYTLKNEDISELPFSCMDHEKLEDDDKKTTQLGPDKV